MSAVAGIPEQLSDRTTQVRLELFLRVGFPPSLKLCVVHSVAQGSGVRGRRGSLSAVKTWTTPHPVQPMVGPPVRQSRDVTWTTQSGHTFSPST